MAGLFVLTEKILVIKPRMHCVLLVVLSIFLSACMLTTPKEQHLGSDPYCIVVEIDDEIVTTKPFLMDVVE